MKKIEKKRKEIPWQFSTIPKIPLTKSDVL